MTGKFIFTISHSEQFLFLNDEWKWGGTRTTSFKVVKELKDRLKVNVDVFIEFEIQTL